MSTGPLPTTDLMTHFATWYAEESIPGQLKPKKATAVLAALYARAESAGGDLSDPTPDLLRWLVRDAARERRGAPDYQESIAALTVNIVFLRATQRWRRSDAVAQRCWAVFDWASNQPIGLDTLGSMLDEVMHTQVTLPVTREQTAATIRSMGVMVPILRTLKHLVEQEDTTRSRIAEVVGLPADSSILDLWIEALDRSGLARVDGEAVRAGSTVTQDWTPPVVTTDLMHAFVSGLVMGAIARGFAQDVEAGYSGIPRGMGVLGALLAAGDDEFYEDGDETTRGHVADLTVPLASTSGVEDTDPLVEDVMRTLGDLAGFGVLTGTAGVLRSPEPLRPLIAAAIADFTGWVGSEDSTVLDPLVQEAPVLVPTRLAATSGLTLRVSPEGVDDVFRRVRVISDFPVGMLHMVVSAEMEWRDLHVHVFEVDGVRRFAAERDLRALGGERDGLITDERFADVGGVIPGVGDELVYEYGAGDAVRRVRIVVEDLVAQVEHPLARLGGEGEAPGEPHAPEVPETSGVGAGTPAEVPSTPQPAPQPVASAPGKPARGGFLGRLLGRGGS